MFKKIIKIVAGIMVFVFIFNCVQNILVGGTDARTTRRINGYYENEKGTIDAVYLGSSATYAFFIAPYVWHEYGITVYPYCSPAQPVQATKFLLEEARKTQPDALYIINLSTIRSDVTEERIYTLFNEMPFSLNKIKAIDYVGDCYEYDLTKKMQTLFPIIKYHSRWSDLETGDFTTSIDQYKSGNDYRLFLKVKKNTGSIGIVDENIFYPLPENIEPAMVDLLDYCEEEKLNVLFVTAPQPEEDEVRVGQLNTLTKMVKDRGFKLFDMRANYEEIDLNFKTDFYNAGHTNMHGALKTSRYISEYLIENYGFEDKRGNTEYSDWDVAFCKYYYECLEPNLIEEDKQYFTVELPSKEDWEKMQ